MTLRALGAGAVVLLLAFISFTSQAQSLAAQEFTNWQEERRVETPTNWPLDRRVRKAPPKPRNGDGVTNDLPLAQPPNQFTNWRDERRIKRHPNAIAVRPYYGNQMVDDYIAGNNADLIDAISHQPSFYQMQYEPVPHPRPTMNELNGSGTAY
jgi:hypothetical protein